MTAAADIVTDDYKTKYGFADSTDYLDQRLKGLSEGVVKEISRLRDEPSWMEEFRLKAFRAFQARPVPTWGVDLSPIKFDEFYYYGQPAKQTAKTWDEVPPEIRNTFEKLGIPEAERKFLAGVGAIYESQEVYNSLQKELSKQGVIFTSVGNAVKEYPDLIRKYIGTIVPANDNKFAALNSAVWSDGPFIYVPEGVKITMPLQSYFRINAQGMGQFERTLIVAEPDSEVHYIEGCTAAMYQKSMLHAAIVELVAKKGAKIRYITIQNWSKNVYNLVTKRAHAYENASVTWLNGEVGSGRNMKYPSIYLLGRGASAEILSMAYAGANQIQDTGGKVIHLASDTSSKIISKSVSKDGGEAIYRGLLHIAKGAHNVKATVRCDALLLDERSKTSTIPYVEVMADDATVTHEASVGKVGEEQIFYLMARGISERDALSMIVNGFVEPFTKELPMTYAIEINRLMALEMTGAVG
ncbi:MAG TPA: Fe-S cluster assembly protein SufB [Nitrososphaerales archaeon]|nr:Fe-S cluster assembly protein SufB [Nitrososphaerales archaeon]